MRAYVVWGMLLVGCCAPVALAFDGAGSRGQSRADMSRSALVPGGPPYIYWTAQACCAEHSHLQATCIFRQSLNSAGGNATVVYMPSSAAQSVSNLAVGDYYLQVLVASPLRSHPLLHRVRAVQLTGIAVCAGTLAKGGAFSVASSTEATCVCAWEIVFMRAFV